MSEAVSTEIRSDRLSELRTEIAGLISRFGHERRDEPFKLSSAGWSHDYVDGKRAIAEGARLKLVGEAFLTKKIRYEPLLTYKDLRIDPVAKE